MYESGTCVRVVVSIDKMPDTVDKMLVSVDIILDFDDIIYTELCFPVFFSYVYTYNIDFIYTTRIKCKLFDMSAAIVLTLSALFVKIQRLYHKMLSIL